jgi:hypothetical protein
MYSLTTDVMAPFFKFFRTNFTRTLFFAPLCFPRAFLTIVLASSTGIGFGLIGIAVWSIVGSS